MKEITCCFTGHREIPAERLSEVKKKLKNEILALIDKGYTCFVAGGAIGFDTLAAITVLEIKQDYPEIKLNLVLPCAGQEKFWSNAQKAEYANILKRADSFQFLRESYTPYCMFERNRKMVDISSAVITFHDGGEKGGTAMTVKYALKKGIVPINIF